MSHLPPVRDQSNGELVGSYYKAYQLLLAAKTQTLAKNVGIIELDIDVKEILDYLDVVTNTARCRFMNSYDPMLYMNRN